MKQDQESGALHDRSVLRITKHSGESNLPDPLLQELDSMPTFKSQLSMVLLVERQNMSHAHQNKLTPRVECVESALIMRGTCGKDMCFGALKPKILKVLYVATSADFQRVVRVKAQGTPQLKEIHSCLRTTTHQMLAAAKKNKAVKGSLEAAMDQAFSPDQMQCQLTRLRDIRFNSETGELAKDVIKLWEAVNPSEWGPILVVQQDCGKKTLEMNWGKTEFVRRPIAYKDLSWS
eukprot:6461572-Amphidinium_carterae.2